MTEETQHKRPKIKTILEIFSHLKEVKKDWKMISILFLLLVVLISSEPFFYKWIIEAVEQKKEIEEIFIIIGAWTLATVGLIFVRGMYALRLLNAANEDWQAMILFLMRKMYRLSIEYHRNIQAGEKYKIVDRTSEVMWEMADNFILMVAPQVAVFFILVIGGLMIDWVFTLCALLFLPVGIYGVMRFGQRAYTRQKEMSTLWDHAFDRLLDGFVNLPVIRMFARGESEIADLRNRFYHASKAQKSVRKNWVQFNAFGRFFTLLASMITVSTGVILLTLGKTDFATFFFFIAFTQRIYGPIMEIFNVVQQTMSKLSYYEKAQEILSMQNERDDGVATLTPVKQSIEFQHITFSYPSSDRVILDDISLSVRRGEKVAFVGHTGSGKSTIIQLLMRFYEPQSGVISIDGQDIYDFSLDSYRSGFGTVFQDTTLFNDTLRHNLSYVRDGITEEQILEACEKANVGEFVAGLELGLDTVVGERGLKLSGGERQRIAIARAILADPDILILDEATSALDTKTEKVVQKAFDTLMEGRTSIIIAHRLSTIMGADRIYMLDHGQIIGSGSHTDLYSSCGRYREMVDLQHDGIVGESDQQSDDSE